MPNPPVTAVIVTYNSGRILAECLPALGPDVPVMVVDNASTDDTLAVVARLAPQARILRNDRNLGFGRANNRALEEVTTPFALLLNPDCVITPAAITRLLAAAADYPEAAILAPKLYDAPGKLGLCYRPNYFAPQPRELLEPAGDLCSEFLTGAAMLLRMDALRTIGFFDPWFFLYLEDDDLCLRVRKAGHSLVLVNDAHVLHKVRQSSAPSLQLDFRRAHCLTLSKLYLLRKHVGGLRAMREGARIFVGALLTLPLHALIIDRRLLVRSWGRLLAALRAPARLRAAHCLPESS